MLGGTMLPLFAVCTFTLHNLPAGNTVTTLKYSNFYVCMLCDSVQVGTEQLYCIVFVVQKCLVNRIFY